VEAALVDLVIDEGVPDRGHRAARFWAALVLCGAAAAPHPVFGCVLVAHLAAAGLVPDLAASVAREAAGPRLVDAAQAEAPRTQWAGELGVCAGCHQPIAGGESSSRRYQTRAAT